MGSFMKISKKLLIGVVVLVVSGAAYFLFGSKSTANKDSVAYWIEPTREDVPVVVNLSGTLQSQQSVNINAPLTRAQRILIELIPEGTFVQKGDVIAVFDSSALDDQIYNLETTPGTGMKAEKKAEEETNILDAESTLQNAKENLKVAQINFDGLKFAAELDKQKGLIELSKAQANVQMAENKLKRAQLKMDIVMREADKFIAEQARKLKTVQDEKDSFTIRAPSEGMIVYPEIGVGGVKRKVQNGDTLWRGQLFLEIPNLYKMEVQIQVPEEMVRKFTIGKPAKVYLDAFPDMTFGGEVDRIDRLASIKQDNPYVKVFNCGIRISDTDLDRLRPGMNARVEVLLNDYKDVTTLPIEAIQIDQDQTSYVFSWENNELKKMSVTIVDQTIEKVIIAEALDDKKILLPNAALLAHLRSPADSKLSVQSLAGNE